MVKKRKLFFIVTTIILPLIEIIATIFLIVFANTDKYLYPVFDVSHRYACFIFIGLLFVMINTLIVYSIFFANKNIWRIISVTVSVIILLSAYVLIDVFVESIWFSETYNADNYMKLEERPKMLIDNHIDDSLTDFDAVISDYHYRYHDFWGEELELTFVASFSEDEYLRWKEIALKADGFKQMDTDADSKYNLHLTFNRKTYLSEADNDGMRVEIFMNDQQSEAKFCINYIYS